MRIHLSDHRFRILKKNKIEKISKKSKSQNSPIIPITDKSTIFDQDKKYLRNFQKLPYLERFLRFLVVNKNMSKTEEMENLEKYKKGKLKKV